MMGVSLTWEPVEPVRQNSFASGSNLHKYMENAFGGFPLKLSEDDIPTLRGISACGYADMESLITAILDNGIVKVEAHW